MFFPIPEDVFILCIVFFTDSGRCFLGPKLSILYSMYPVMVIYIYILYNIIYIYIYMYITIMYTHRDPIPSTTAQALVESSK